MHEDDGISTAGQTASRSMWYWIAAVGIVVVVLVALIFWPRKPQAVAPLVVEPGVQYRLLGFHKAIAPSEGGKRIPTYLVFFTYRDSTDIRRGSIHVPKSAIILDRALATNTVVWDREVTIEGRSYSGVRWNPAHIERASDEPVIAQEQPLRRDR